MRRFFSAIKNFTLTTMACVSLYSLTAVAQPFTSEPEGSIELAKVDQWHLGFALGYGKIENVILDQSDLSIYAVPTVSFYGNQLFFDNGTLGYSFLQQPNYTVSVVSEVNPYSAQFYDYHPINVFLLDSAQSSADQQAEAASPSNDPLTNNSSAALGDDANFIDDVLTEIVGPITKQREPIVFTTPEWNLDMGLQHNWFLSNHSTLVSQLFTDISQLHNGHRATLTWSNQYLSPKEWGWFGNIRTNIQVGLTYLDAKTTQYFYGIDERHTSEAISHFKTSSAVNTHFSISAKKPIDEHLSAIVYWKSTSLDQSIYLSPRIEDRYADRYFVGLIYDF